MFFSMRRALTRRGSVTTRGGASAFSLALVVAGCGRPVPPVAAPAQERAPELTILAMNDFHGALHEVPLLDQPGRAAGGLPWLSAAVRSIRDEGRPVLLLDGGDCFQGGWAVNQSRGMAAIDALDHLGVAAAAVGNHEFDYGGAPGGHPLRGALERAAAASRHPLLSANVYDVSGARWQPNGIAPWTVLEIAGLKVGVVGLTPQDTPTTTSARHVADLRFTDPVAAVNEALVAFDAARVDVRILTGHLTGKCAPKSMFEVGEPCLPDGEIGAVLSGLPRGALDVIVAGHAHTLMAHRWEDTFVLENRDRGQVLGRVDLAIGAEGVEPARSTLHAPWALVHDAVEPGCADTPFPMAPRDVGGRTLTPDADAVSLVETWSARAGDLCEPVACAVGPLGRARDRESATGDLVADAMRAAFPGADLAVQNSGGLRADLPGGTLRREHVQALMPFENRLLLVELSGARLLEVLRVGSSGEHGILQVSEGTTYRFDPARTGGSDLDGDGQVSGWERDRLCAATVGGAPVDPGRTYRIVLTDFLLGGGDHVGHALTDARVIAEGPALRDAIEAHVRSATTCVGGGFPAGRVVLGACEP